MTQRTYSIHVTPCSLHPLELSASQGLPCIGSGEPILTVPSLGLGIPSQSMGVCLVVRVTGVANDLDKRDVVKNPLHRTQSCTRVQRKLLGTGSTQSPGHTTGDSPGMFPCIPGGIPPGIPPGTFLVGGLPPVFGRTFYPAFSQAIML